MMIYECLTLYCHTVKWFKANPSVLNVEKTSIVRLTPAKLSHYPVMLVYVDVALTELDTLKLLGLYLDNHLSWKPHIDFVLHKLGIACFVIRRLSHVLGIDAIRTACYSCFHSLIKYDIVVWGNSYNITKVFLLQKRMIE
jgi:hypothetical protein